MNKLEFHRKKSSVLPDLRPMYKISTILIILKLCCTGEKSSLLKLHLFNWALLDTKKLNMLETSADKKELLLGVWGIDPALNMALHYSLGEGLVCKLNNGSYKLTRKGDDFIIGSDLPTLLDGKVAVLKRISKRISEKMVTESANRWKNEA